MLLLWQYLITSLTLECGSLNDFRVIPLQQKNQGPGILFLIWILLFWEKGEISCFTEEITFETRYETFCMSAWRATTFYAYCRWCMFATIGRRNWATFSWEYPCKHSKESQELVGVLTGGIAWASSFSDSPVAWNSLKLCETAIQPFIFLWIDAQQSLCGTHPHYRALSLKKEELTLTTACCALGADWNIYSSSHLKGQIHRYLIQMN